jgi:hypothetical protein
VSSIRGVTKKRNARFKRDAAEGSISLAINKPIVDRLDGAAGKPEREHVPPVAGQFG